MYLAHILATLFMSMCASVYVCVQASYIQFYNFACGVMVTVVRNYHSEPSSNPGRDCFAFHIALIPLGKV